MQHPNARVPRARYLAHHIQVTLEELYNSSTRQMGIQRRLLCVVCAGNGARSATAQQFDTCELCKGDGKQNSLITRNNGMQESVTEDCEMCLGDGWAHLPQNRCGKCRGKRTVLGRAAQIVRIRKGMRHLQKIIHKGEGCQVPNRRPGDLIFILETVDHPIFTRKGNDLHMTMRLELVEAVCGFNKVITTLDNRRLVVRSTPTHVIADNEQKCIMGEGMPIYFRPTEKGDLIVKFEVKFPEKIPLIHIPLIEQCLRGRQQARLHVNMVELPNEDEDMDTASNDDNYHQHNGNGEQDDHHQYGQQDGHQYGQQDCRQYGDEDEEHDHNQYGDEDEGQENGHNQYGDEYEDEEHDHNQYGDEDEGQENGHNQYGDEDEGQENGHNQYDEEHDQYDEEHEYHQYNGNGFHQRY